MSTAPNGSPHISFMFQWTFKTFYKMHMLIKEYKGGLLKKKWDYKPRTLCQEEFSTDRNSLRNLVEHKDNNPEQS